MAKRYGINLQYKTSKGVMQFNANDISISVKTGKMVAAAAAGWSGGELELGFDNVTAISLVCFDEATNAVTQISAPEPNKAATFDQRVKIVEDWCWATVDGIPHSFRARLYGYLYALNYRVSTVAQEFKDAIKSEMRADKEKHEL